MIPKYYVDIVGKFYVSDAGYPVYVEKNNNYVRREEVKSCASR